MSVDGKGDILIIDDEPNALRVLSAILSEDGYRVFESRDVDGATSLVSSKDVDAIITDLKMPGKDGMQFFEYITESHPHIPVIFLTAFGSVESAVSAITRGAFYYFVKPPDYHKLKSTLARAVKQRQLKRALDLAEKGLSNGNEKSLIVTNTPEMRKIFKTVEDVRDSTSSVLICGETGTGKELIARALHYSSTRSDKPFIAVNCAAIPRDLMESELFGYEKGAYTGATGRRIGRFEEASGGTIFLDEIGELEAPLQAKLLRVLQEREIERLGSSKRIKVEFRVISSTNRDLQREVQTKHFREDLYYRINVVRIDLPPLREKKDDIPLLVTEFVREFCVRNKKMLTISDDVMRILQRYDWPGNIRQLKNTIERAVVLAKGSEVTARELPEELRCLLGKREPAQSGKTLKEIEIEAVKEVLRDCSGNKSKAAKTLGISRKALYKRLKESDTL